MIISTSMAMASANVISLGVSAGAAGAGGALISILLILLLSSKELISSSVLNSPEVRRALDLAIVPLLIVFALNVAYMVAM